MKKTHRLVTLASIVVLGLSSITVPIAQADPVAPIEPGVSIGEGTSDSIAVTLITGDTVYVGSDGEVTGVTPGPRPDGTVPQMSAYEVGSQHYVVPSDVRLMIGNQLDRELFNVTKLASYDLERAIPVIVAPADEASTLTPDVEAMGVEVDNTLDAVSAQTGLAEVNAESGPAPAWALLEELDTAPTSAADPVSSDTKVWLDERYQLAPFDEADTDLVPPVWMTTIGADQAHETGLTGEGVVVGVVDTGIDSNHPDLVGKVIAEQDFTESGYAFDVYGHGTFVASEIAGTGAASDGTYVGVAPGAALINARVLDDYGYGFDSGIVAGMEWACQQGADIVNMSLGNASILDDGSSFMSQAVNRVSRQYGCLIVIAAGNQGYSQTVTAPGTADEALTVGATYQDGTQTIYSSIGPRRGDGAVKPEIMAPGSSLPIINDDGQMVDYAGIVGAALDGGYTTNSGTSMATPLVAGAAALLKQSDPSLDRTEIRARLMASAVPLDMTVFEQGSGMLNIPGALSQQVTTSPTQLNFGEMTPPYPESVTATLMYVNQGGEDVTYELTAQTVFTDSVGLPTPSDQGVEPYAASAITADQPLLETSSDGIILSNEYVTIPAGGSASIDVEANPSLFGVGYVGGYVTAVADDGTMIRTPLGWGNQPETVILTVTATRHDGLPIGSDEDYEPLLTVVNTETGMWQDVRGTPGTSRARVIPGDYVVFMIDLMDNDDGWVDSTFLIHPKLTIDSDTDITLDGTAARPVAMETEQASYARDYSLYVRDANTGLTATPWFYLDAVNQFQKGVTYVTPVDEPGWTLQPSIMAYGALAAVSFNCGQSSIPLELIQSPLEQYNPSGQYSYTVAEPTSGSGQDSVALEHWEPSDTNDEAHMLDVFGELQDEGYAALVIDMDHPYDSAGAIRQAVADFGSSDNPPSLRVYLTTTDVADQMRAEGRMDILLRTQNDYIYVITQEFDLSGDEPFTVVANSGNTATLAVKHPGVDTIFTYDEFTISGDWTTYTMEALESYTAYVSADQALMFATTTRPGFEWDEWTKTEALYQIYEAGTSTDLIQGARVQSTSLNPLGRGLILRTGDTLSGPVPLFVDGEGLYEIDRTPGYGAVNLTLTDVTTGETLIDGYDGTGQFTSPPLVIASHTYRLDVDAASALRRWSNDVQTSWTWQSAYSDWESEPLRQVWYELPGLDADNAGGEEQTIVIHVAQQLASATLPLEDVSLQASTDGVTWSDVPVSYVGHVDTRGYYIVDEDLYSGTIAAHSGQTVSLKSSVSGWGSSFDQTVMNAYSVTDSPRSYTPLVTWSSCNGGWDTTPPDPPKVDHANASSVSGGPGAAEPGSTVTVTFPDGTTGTDVASDDGSYRVATGSGMVSGQISVTATDAAGNVSDPTTAWLDADRPDAPRIDRADLTQVSGLVGAAEANSEVSVSFPDGTVLTTIAQENGSYAVATPVGMVLGLVTVTVTDAAGNVSDPTTAQLVAPSSVSVTLRYQQLQPGDSQTVTGSNFRPLERVSVNLCSSAGCTIVKTAYASLSGTVTTSFTVPKTAEIGTYTVTVTGTASGSASATFQVVSPPPSPQCWLLLLISTWLKILGL